MKLITNTILVAVLMAANGVTAGDDTAKVKKIVDGAKKAIVQVEIVWEIKITYKGQEQPARETKVVRNGVVINEEGLTILSATSVTPQVPGRNSGIKLESNPQSVKFILDDATEIAAEIALKDKDLDLMYVKPSEKLDKKFPFLNLEKSVKVDVLDKIVTLSRLGDNEDRTVMYFQHVIHGIIEKPRKYFIASSGAAGMPAFTMDGKCFGLFLKRKGSGAYRILPSEDILESATQVTEE